MDYKRKSWIVTLITAMAVTVFYAINYDSGKNVKMYVVLVILALLLYYVLYASLALIEKKYPELNGAESFFITLDVLAAIAVFSFGVLCLINEGNQLGVPLFLDRMFRRAIKMRYYIPILILVGMISFDLIKKNILRSNMVLRMVWSIVLSIIVSYKTYSPVPFLDNYGTLYHANAYENAIINVLIKAPFSDVSTSIYGHYGILISLFAFGDGMRGVATSIAIIAGISFLCIYCLLSKYLKNDVLFYFSSLSILFISFSLYYGGQYYQAIPHRILFPAGVLVFLSISKADRKIDIFAEVLLITLAFVWNFETAVFSACSVVAVKVLRTITTYQRNVNKLIKTVIAQILCISVAFFLAIGLVDIYNVLNGGGTVSIKAFLFPLVGSSLSDAIRANLEGITYLYLAMMICFIVVAASGTLHALEIFIGDSKTDIDQELIIMKVGIAISGLVSMIYYMNRPAYSNISTALFQFIVLVAIIVDEKSCNSNEKASREEKFRIGLFGLIAVTVLAFFAVEATLSIENNLLELEVRNKNIEELDKFESWIEDTVPEETFACGCGISEVYYDMDRYTDKMAVADWADVRVDLNMNEPTYHYVKDMLLNSNDFFVEQSVLETIRATDPEDADKLEKGYTIEGEYFICNYRWVYFKKNEI